MALARCTRRLLVLCVSVVAGCASLPAASASAAPPETSIVAGPADGSSINDATPTFEFVADQPAVVFACTLDANLVPFVCSSPLTLPVLADGPHRLSVAAAGVTGIDMSPAERAFAVDTVAPDTTITSGPPDGAVLNYDTPHFAWASSDAVSFTCRVDDLPIESCESAFATAVSKGPHSFSVAAVDAAGNIDPTPAVRRFTVAVSIPAPPTGCRATGTSVTATNGNDTTTGTARTDILFGRRGNDVLRGLGGRDCLYGGAGRDRLVGGTGNDLLNGGPGADRLVDGRGRDTFTGGAGKDRIDAVDAAGARAADTVRCGTGSDVAIVDRDDRVAQDCERVRRR